MGDRTILIAGGGIAGLAASLGATKAGREARVFEKAEAFAEVGAGLQMSPNAVSALQYLGAWEAVEPHCVIPTEIHMRDGLTGALLQRIRLGKGFEQRFGAPYRVAHRADLLSGLLTTARAEPRVTLTTGATVTTAATTADGAELKFASGRIETGAAVIAADGIRSSLRASLIPGSAPVDHGHVFYRTLLPIELLPPSVVADAVTLWLMPGGHAVHYAVSNWRSFNIIAVAERKFSEAEWSTPAASGEVQAAFRTAATPLRELIAVPQSWFRWQAADLAPLATWTHGNIALTGDAAHATLPYLAQGAAMSLEDAATLSHCLTNSRLVTDAISEFARARQSRTARIQRESRRVGEAYHASSLRRLARNAVLRLMSEPAFLARLAWIYAWTPDNNPHHRCR